MRRTRGREVALQTLYQKELNASVDGRRINAFVRRRLKHTPQLLDYTKNLIAGVEAKKAELDDRIQAISENWRLDRMPPLDRNILRIGLFEMQYGGEETPPRVALDEAVELAKRYGTDQSGKFVNGLLDRFLPGHSADIAAQAQLAAEAEVTPAAENPEPAAEAVEKSQPAGEENQAAVEESQPAGE